MTVPDWATTVSGVIAVGAVVGLGGRNAVRTIIKDYLSELKPNSGSSMKDTVNRLEKRIDEIYKLLAQQNVKTNKKRKPTNRYK